MKFLKSVFNFLIGLLAVIFVYAVKLFFLVTSIVALGAIGYSAYWLLTLMFKGDHGIPLFCMAMTILFSMGYLYITTLLKVGMSDIFNVVNIILHFMGKSKTNNGNSRMGEKGVFKR